jgi:subtilisin-like proprotein convertase family protein
MVMRTGTWDKQLQGHRGRDRARASKGGRKGRPRLVELEGLESRTLLATIPAATATAAPSNLSNLVGNVGGTTAASESSTQVAVDPNDPSKLVAVWVDNDPTLFGDTDNTIQVVVEAAYSINSGQSWLPLLIEPITTLGSLPPGTTVSPELFNPATSGPTVPYVDQTSPSLGFDDSGNFYILSEFTGSGGGSGALALEKYNFNGSFPTGVDLNTNQQTANPYPGSGDDLKVIYEWDSSADDEAIDPTMVVDDNQATVPTGVTTQADPNSGNVYVAWSGIDVNTAVPIPDFNPNRIKVEVSSDGGNNFSPMTIADQGDGLPVEDGNGPTPERDADPALTVAQGRLASENGQANDLGIPGGQVTVGWDDFGDGNLLANTISAGQDYSFSNQTPTDITEGTVTSVPITVSINKTTGLDTLDVTVNIVDSNDTFLGLTLVAPNGATFELLANQVPFIGATANTGQGIGGANLGVVTYTNNDIPFYAMGTTFDDNATRDIFDSTTTGTNGLSAPAIGDFRPETFETLDTFLAEQLAAGSINGTWKLELNDTNTPPTTPPTTPNFILNWSLSFGKGLVADNDVLIPNVNDSTDLLVTPINSYAAAGVTSAGTLIGTVPMPSSPVDVGSNVVMAEDNTLGGDSPFEGRIYLAYVGYYNDTIDGLKNPVSNTDIFLTFSNDGGRTWSDPVEVNDDNNNGSSGGNEDSVSYNNEVIDQLTGPSQYQPAIAVDPTTGTVVLSWRDSRDDTLNNNLVATYLTASIDGGNTFNAQVFANPDAGAIDAITDQTDSLGPESDNATALAVNETYGYGSSMGLAVYDGQVYPVWAGNFNEAFLNSSGATVGVGLSVYVRPMVIAAGPRVVSSQEGPVAFSEAEAGAISFTVTFDRPIDPQIGVQGVTPGSPTWSFYEGDVQVYYEGTTFGETPLELPVTGLTPVIASGVGPDNKFGFTEFTVTFSTAKVPNGNFTGTYSYLITPDDENGNPIEESIPSFVLGYTPDTKNPGTFSSGTIDLPIPTSGTGGTNTNGDFTISTIGVGGFNNQLITGVTVNLTMSASVAAGLSVTLTAPDGQTANVPVVDDANDDGSLSLVNASFVLAGLDGGLVDGGYTLTIDDQEVDDRGTLTSWSVTLDGETPGSVFQSGDADDQNADGTTDENPLTLPNGYTGLTPGDIYAMPTPDPTTPVTFTTAQSILSPVEFSFDQNTLPLIVPGPQVLSTEVIGTSGQVVSGSTGSQDLLVDDTTSQYQVTFDRPMQVSSFTPGQVVSIIGPEGPVTAPQSYPSTSVDQSIPAATTAGSGSLSSALTINSGGTLAIQDLTVSLSIASTSDAGLTAELVAPNGTTIPLFSGVGGSSGQNFDNTVFSDSATTSIASGTAPFTGTYLPEYTPSSATLTSLQGKSADGTWNLVITNTSTGVASTLDSWSLNVTPVITVTPVPSSESDGGKLATQFTIGFPRQQLSGTYTLQLGPNILDQFGNAMDPSDSAGLDALRDFSQNGPTTPVKYTSSTVPVTIPASSTSPTGQATPGSASSSIVVPDSFVIEGDKTAAGQSVMQLQLNISFANDQDLTAYLYHYDSKGDLLNVTGEPLTLFSGVGSGGANFDNTVFDDNAATPIQEGSAPFFATYDPQESLAATFAPPTGQDVQGTWTLVVENNGTAITGAINSWSMTFQKSLPTTGLGGADTTLTFTISTLAQSDALSSEQWTAVGAESSTSGAGEVTAIAVDPSDPSGNTVYAAGASGGVWKTTDFLTTNPDGPTWIPLTNFGPNAALNISSIAIFPVNDNTAQSIIIAATGGASAGENNTDAPGVGFLISTDGGTTWNVYDSSTNVDANGNLLPIDSTARNREFVGTTAYQVAVDPQPTPTGGVIIYAALSGTNGGIWRSENTGQTWTQVLAGNATAVVLDQDSGIVLDPSTGTDVQGNLQIIYAGIEGTGVFMSTNQGQNWTLMAGGVGNPLIENGATGANADPATNPTPNGGNGRITPAVPTPTSNTVWNQIYAGWLYAAVATSSGGFDGLFVTKDFGENWTQVSISTALPDTNFQSPQTIPSGQNGNDDYNQAIPIDAPVTSTQYPITDLTQGNLDLTLTVDPTDPSILYLGGFGGDDYNSDTGLIRVNTTLINDAHSLVSPIDLTPGHNYDLNISTNDPLGATTINTLQDGPPIWEFPLTTQLPAGVSETTPFLNFIRNPYEPFLNDASLYVFNYASFTNNGANVSWVPFDMPGTGYQAAVAEVDPTTGLPRLIFGNDDGIWSALDDNGTIESSIGSSDATPGIDRNGNLQVAQFYSGVVQPSSAAAETAQSLFFGAAQNTGVMSSNFISLTPGQFDWTTAQETEDGFTDFEPSPLESASSVDVDQQGSGTLYDYEFPFEGSAYLNFVMVDGTGRTFGLLQASDGVPGPTDPQWTPMGIADLVVDPVNDQDMLISSSTGNIFASTNQGETWADIGTPATFGSPGQPSLALAYGAPDPSAPENVGNLGNFIYVGTGSGAIYVSQNAGGSWTDISTGLDGSAVKEIITDPARGSHDAYAVTEDGVYYMADSVGTTPTWVNITGGLKTLAYSIFGQSYNPAADPNTIPYDLATVLNSIAANWNYVIPNDPSDLADGYHPVLYVAADSGVYMSSDNGTTWVLYPTSTFGAVSDGGDLPHVDVTDLSLSQGNIAVATGMPDLAGPYNPEDPTPTDTFSGTLTDGSATVTDVSSFTDMVVGATVVGNGIPNGTTVKAINTTGDTVTLTEAVTIGGSEQLTTNPPDPDLLMASTYGEGSFVITLAPMLFNTTSDPVQVDSSDTSGTAADGTTLVTTAMPTIDGTSEISGFGGATWVTIVDETPGDADYGQVIGGFNPADVTATTKSITADSSNSTDAYGNFQIPISTAFGSNGLKTIEVYTTDDAGAKSNPVTITFTLQATNIVVPPPTSPPGAPTLAFASTVNTIGGVPVTALTDLGFTGTTVTGTTVTVTETWTNPPTGYANPTMTVPAADITYNSDGSFNFVFQDFTVDGTPVTSGTFTVSATAAYISNPNKVGPSDPSAPVTFEIDATKPDAVADLRLNPVDEIGVPGSNVTSDRTPYFIGTVVASDPLGYTVELFINGQAAVQSTAVVGATQTDADGKAYNFLIQLPYNLNNGETSVYVQVIDPAGNVSADSNTVGVVINSMEDDYNGGTTSDPAVFDRDTANNQLQVTVQTPAGSAPPWFGPSGTPFTPSNVFTGTLTSGSASVTGLSSLDGLVAGQNITGTGIPAGTTILAVNSATSTLTLSAKATASGSSTLTSTDPADDEVPFEGDFDGDGLTDLAFYNLSTGTWTIDESSNYATQGPETFTMGTPNSSIPTVGYFSPNGGQLTQAPQVAQAEEVAVMTYKNGQDIWTIDSTTEGDYTVTMAGQAGDIPVPGDYDGVGYDQLAVYRPATSSTPAEFIVLQQNYSSSTGTVTYSTQTINIGQYLAQFGLAADATQLVPVPDQYNNVAASPASTTPVFGKTEAAVYDPVKGEYLILGPSGAYTVSGFKPGDIPAPGDYLGNGSDQAVVYRPSTGQFIEGSESGTLTTLATMSQTHDIPLTSPLYDRLPSTVLTTPTPTPTTPTPTPTTPTPTPTTPTPTPTTPTPTPTTPTPTPTPSATPLVEVTGIELEKNKKGQVTEIVVTFSGAVNAAQADNTAIYHLANPGKGGSYTAKNAKVIRLSSASYNAANDTVTLVPRKAFAVAKKPQLIVYGQDLQDSLGRPIDGGDNGQSGSNATAILAKNTATYDATAYPWSVSKVGKVTIDSVTVGPASPSQSVTPVVVDAVIELDAAASLVPSHRSKKYD